MPILSGGQYVAKAPPMNHFRGTGPQKRLSSLDPRLSPIMNQCPGGTVIALGYVQPCESPQGSVYGSLIGLPLRITCPLRISIRSPGSPTTRLMKLTDAFVCVGRVQISFSLTGTPHVGPLSATAPCGGWKT